MKTARPNKQEKLYYELLCNWDDMSLDTIDEYISKFTDQRLISLTMWLRDCKTHLEEIAYAN